MAQGEAGKRSTQVLAPIDRLSHDVEDKKLKLDPIALDEELQLELASTTRTKPSISLSTSWAWNP